MITVLAFLVTIGVLIVIHEYGHYRVARACGVKVLRFSVGFGRVIWRRQKDADSTEFVVSALPLGGYVRMLDERDGKVPASQRAMAFNNKPLWQRSAIVAAGPAANLLLAVLLYACVHWIGMDEPKAVLGSPPAASVAERAGLRAGDWVREVSTNGEDWREVSALPELRWEVTQAVIRGADGMSLRVSDLHGRGEREIRLAFGSLDANDVDAQLMRRLGLSQVYGEPIMGNIVKGGPADAAGLREGDRVLSVNGAPVQDAARLREVIRGSIQGDAGQEMIWRVERRAATVELAVTPVVASDGPLRVGRVEAAIGSAPEFVKVQYGPWEGFSLAAARTWDMSVVTLRMFGKMLVGEASLRNLSGPLTIADYAGQSAQLGMAYYLGFLAVVSISLGIINLLPLPMLDGGHLMYYLFEAVTGRPVSEMWLERLQRGGVAIMLMFMSLALYNDVARFMGLH